MGPKRILIIGNYGAGNLGDDAILAGMVTELRSTGYRGKIEITHGGFESSPEVYKGLKKVPFVPFGIRSRFRRKQKKAAYEAIKRADLVILGGGGLFVDSETVRAPLLWAKQAKACRKMKTPYICYGQSVGPLKRWISRRAVKKTFKGAKEVHVRDKASVQTLKKLGVENVTMGSDPAFSWLQAQKKRPKKNLLVVSLREWDENTQEVWEPALRELRKFAIKKKLKLVMLAMDLRNQKEINNLRETGLESFEAPSALLAYQGMSSAKMAVTMRLHAGVFALAAGIPLVALSYSQKVESLIKSLNVKGGVKVIPVDKFSASKLKKAMESLSKAGPSRFNMETPIMQNQAFLAHALELH